MGRFLYFLIVMFLARTFIRAAVGWLTVQKSQQSYGGPRPSPRGPSAPPATIHKGLMVRDPVCGVHVPESRAISETKGGERFFFCSEKCRRAYLEAS